MKNHTALALLVVASALLAACGGEGDAENGPLRCNYEQRSTRCSGSGFGAWESRCLDIEDPRDDLTPSGWCNLVTSDTTECAASCCVQYQFRNASGSEGLCP